MWVYRLGILVPAVWAHSGERICSRVLVSLLGVVYGVLFLCCLASCLCVDFNLWQRLLATHMQGGGLSEQDHLEVILLKVWWSYAVCVACVIIFSDSVSCLTNHFQCFVKGGREVKKVIAATFNSVNLLESYLIGAKYWVKVKFNINKDKHLV